MSKCNCEKDGSFGRLGLFFMMLAFFYLLGQHLAKLPTTPPQQQVKQIDEVLQHLHYKAKTDTTYQNLINHKK